MSRRYPFIQTISWLIFGEIPWRKDSECDLLGRYSFEASLLHWATAFLKFFGWQRYKEVCSLTLFVVAFYLWLSLYFYLSNYILFAVDCNCKFDSLLRNLCSCMSSMQNPDRHLCKRKLLLFDCRKWKSSTLFQQWSYILDEDRDRNPISNFMVKLRLFFYIIDNVIFNQNCRF